MKKTSVEMTSSDWKLLLLAATAYSRSAMETNARTSFEILDIVMDVFGQVEAVDMIAKLEDELSGH